MAGVHTYKHENQYVTLYAIDHSVGTGGRNLIDDVQLIQILINRYIDATEAIYKDQGPTWKNSRALNSSGRLIDKLVVDGDCGPFTKGAIWAVERSLNNWKWGCAVDGRIDADPYSGNSYHETGRVMFTYKTTNAQNKEISVNFMEDWWSVMYWLASLCGARPDMEGWDPKMYKGTEQYGLPQWDSFSLPEPLKSSILRSSIGATIDALGHWAKNGG